ncbi:CAMK/CAMKL protein kinase [Thecamonas trahens ATCC 50062]|uniref:CAMK/CAMKL protein kinase n=1 Tax=Thecamonas trahens ATCC 50062 TaxID=461836 RepID=A0A0L0D8Y2_THETB|nr:CAMK/CAMKL protein kinase [Thecamonas trahens ATCC 50062]KNC48531.1 CAMK/CAMKL protein kinase [Thecamonas trahens ATCC 50062]|eukprot:XP_013758639.1 CAMK/CAMKL protein kinase [Thecamonas trahens ATCC 50062]
MSVSGQTPQIGSSVASPNSTSPVTMGSVGTAGTSSPSSSSVCPAKRAPSEDTIASIHSEDVKRSKGNDSGGYSGRATAAPASATAASSGGCPVAGHGGMPVSPPLEPEAGAACAAGASKQRSRRRHHKKKKSHNSVSRRVAKSRAAAMSISKTMTIQQGFQGVITATSDSIIRSANPYAARMFGWKSDELAGERLEVLMPVHFAEQHHTFIRRHEERGANRAIGITRRVEGLHLKGHTFNMLLHVTELTTTEGAPLYVALVEHDDTPTGHTVIDTSGIITYVNNSMTDIFGYSKLELEGFNVKKLMPEPYSSAHDGFLTSYIETGVKKVLDKVRHVPGLHKNGLLFPISLRVKELRTDDGQRFEALIDRVEDMECMMTFDSSGIIKSVTPSFRLMYGYESRELVGHHVSKLLGDMRSYEMSTASFEAMAKSLAEFESEMQRLKLGSRRLVSYHKDGSEFVVCLTIDDYFPLELVRSSSSSADSHVDSLASAGGEASDRSVASVDRSTRMFSAFFTPWIDPADVRSGGESPSSSSPPDANDVWRAAGEEATIEVSHPALAKYSFSRLLGKGSSGEVRLATVKATGELRAIKIVRTDKLEPDSIDLIRLHNEIALLKVCDHENVVKLFDVVETETRLYLVMEYIDGSDLVHLWHYDNPLEPGLTEDEARRLLIPIVQAIHYLHRNNIVHRDIKLDNVMVNSAGDVKLVDFGFATTIESGQLLSSWCGTPFYASPACFLHTPYDQRADIWSLGVLLYLLMEGQMPFETPQAIVAGSYYLPPKWSPALRDLMSNMLVVNEAHRFTISDVALHPWLRGQSTL